MYVALLALVGYPNVCVCECARARAPVFNKVRRARFLFFFTLCPPRAYWRNAEKGQVVTVVTGTVAAVVTGKRVRRRRRRRLRARCRRRAIQRRVCAKNSASATRARTGNVAAVEVVAVAAPAAETLPFVGIGGPEDGISTRTWLVGRVYRPWRNNNRDSAGSDVTDATASWGHRRGAHRLPYSVSFGPPLISPSPLFAVTAAVSTAVAPAATRQLPFCGVAVWTPVLFYATYESMV